MFKVMIVDDEWIVRQGIKMTIPWLDMHCQVVAEADNGLDALRIFHEVLPDIVLTDIRMPGMDGLSLMREIREQYPTVTAIFLTGFDDFSYAQEAIKIGAFELILKPSDPEDLRRVVGEATRQITIQRQQIDYRRSLENHQKTNQPFVLEKVLYRLMMDNASIKEVNLLYKALEGRLELFDDYRIAILDYSKVEGDSARTRSLSPDHSIIDSFLMQHALTEAIALEDHSYAILLNESGGSKWRFRMKELMEHKDVAVTLSLSHVHHGLLTLGQAYAEACLAHFYHAFPDHPPIIDYEVIHNEDRSSLEWNERELVEAMKWGDDQAVRQALQDLYKSVLWDLGGRKMKQKQIGIQLLFVVYHLLNLHFREFEGLPELKQVMDEVNGKRSCKAILEWLENMVTQVNSQYIKSKLPIKNEMEEVRDYINTHFTEEVKMYELASGLHMSESSFSKLFKKQFGISFVDYITELRINKAKELLLDPEIRIGEIARMVGYTETRYFSQLFKKVTGETQQTFRMKVQKLHYRAEK
ncbi:response regulator [Paenibacillus sp. MAHUQ-46]|uniref:Response regulator n=2 Tax=Paenibacillus TaxID=44249 RepID=A0A934MTL3_9BACL|nr:response regulator [Paenibacillus roseus]MBJ6364329.1 response regulator [Paenibacillus roseus]